MIITVANQKGGTGKSTTAAAIATGAAYKGKKTLAIDLDPQGNLSYIMSGNPADVGAYELITGQARPKQVIQHTKQGDIITGNINLASADTTFQGTDRVFSLKATIEQVIPEYDVIVIDTPPTLGTLLLNALSISDKIIIPLNADILSLQGLYLLVQTIQNVQEHYNPGLNVGGVLFTKQNTRTILARDLTDVIADSCKEKGIPVLNTFIREGIAVKEAQTARESLFEYAPKSKPAQDYLQLLTEIGL